MHELRFAIRSLAKQPTFSIVVVLTLALGVGATTSIFSVVHGALIRSAPFPHSARMVLTPQEMKGTGFRRWYWSYRNYQDVLKRATSFEQLEGVYLGTVVLTGRDEPRRMFVRYVTPGFLEMHGAHPVLGRSLGPEDDRVPGGHPVAVITHQLWQRSFGGRSDVLGTTLNLSGTPYTIIGVLNREFEYPFGQDIGSVVELWLPAMMTGQAHPRGDALFSERESGAFSLIGTLAEGVSLEEAQAEMDLLAASLEREHPDVNGGYGIAVIDWNDITRGPVRGPLLVLLGGSLVLLLVGCFNIANLMLVRGTERKRDLAVHLALGGERRDLARALGTEALVLALSGGAVGVIAAYLALPVLLKLVQGSLAITSTQLPPTADVSLNATVLCVAFGASVLAGALFGILPALMASDLELRAALTGTERHGVDRQTVRIRSALVVFEIATATVLLATSTLLVRNFYEMRQVDLGFTTERLLTLRANLPPAKYSDEDHVARTVTTLRERLSAVHGVEWADVWGPDRPGRIFSVQTTVPEGMRVDEAASAPKARAISIGAGGLERIGIPLRQGREFTDADRLDSPPVAVVSESLARKLWPGEDAIGRRLGPFVPMDAGPKEVTVWTVVGVAADANHGGRAPSPSLIQTGDDIYFPFSQRPVLALSLVVRTRGTPNLEAIQRAVWSVDPDIPLFDIATMDQLLAREEGPARFSALLMTTFGVAALLLAALGVYGVLAFAVSQRRREIGLRTALGARTPDTLRQFLRYGARLAVAGVVLGSALTVGVERWLASVVRGVGSVDLPVLLVASASLFTVALVACLLPARRAARIDPVLALRD